ncbi:MAG: restriction endonuclease subunit S [Pirellulales bacterium]
MECKCPSGWRMTCLPELGELNRGRSRHRPRYAEHLYGGPYPFIQTGDIKASNGRITSYTQTYSELGLAQSRLWPAGTMCITIAANIAETAILTFPACFPDSVVGFIPTPGQADVRFIEYTFRYLRQQIQHEATGSVQDNINLETLQRLRFPVPPLSTQRAIAAILGALDDKIELNRRMTATLEAMARALFQSWFVDFDPVRAKLDGRHPAGMDAATATLFPAGFQDTEAGHIPNGWTARRLPDAIEVNPRRNLTAGTIAPYLDMRNLPTQGHSAEEIIDREFSSGTKFQHGDTLLARITPCLENGKTGYVDFLESGQVGWGSTEFIVLAPKPPLPPQFGYLLARSDALRSHAIQNMTGTSGRQRVPSECLNSFWLAVPPLRIARRFDELTAPLIARIKANSSQSRTLAALRDTLLPKLLSGELRIRDAERFVGRVV